MSQKLVTVYFVGSILSTPSSITSEKDGRMIAIGPAWISDITGINNQDIPGNGTFQRGRVYFKIITPPGSGNNFKLTISHKSNFEPTYDPNQGHNPADDYNSIPVQQYKLLSDLGATSLSIQGNVGYFTYNGSLPPESQIPGFQTTRDIFNQQTNTDNVIIPSVSDPTPLEIAFTMIGTTYFVDLSGTPLDGNIIYGPDGVSNMEAWWGIQINSLTVSPSVTNYPTGNYCIGFDINLVPF